MPAAPAAHLPAGEAAQPVAPWDVGRGAGTRSLGRSHWELEAVAAVPALSCSRAFSLGVCTAAYCWRSFFHDVLTCGFTGV